MDTLKIKKVNKGTNLSDKLICFVENFSWEDVKYHMLGELQTWTFTDWETPFAAIINDQIVGIAYIRKEDYYPLPEIYPWVSGIFVAEDYRGHRISEKLIFFANEYAKKNGFDTKSMDIVISGILLIMVMEQTDCMLKKYDMKVQQLLICFKNKKLN